MQDDDRTLILGALDHAQQYADEVFIWAGGMHGLLGGLREDVISAGGGFINVGPDFSTRHFRSHAFRVMRKDQPNDAVCTMFLEVGQRVSDFDVVRPTIEFNNGKIITAIRRFRWDDDHYRVDGPYAAQRMPVAGPAVSSSEWSNGLTTAPDWMWGGRVIWVEAPFEIIDITFTFPDYRWDDGEPVLEPIPGRVFL